MIPLFMDLVIEIGKNGIEMDSSLSPEPYQAIPTNACCHRDWRQMVRSPKKKCLGH